MKSLTLIAGREDSGKTGFCLSTIGYNMELDPNFTALWIESEDSLDVEKAAKLHHIDLNRFYCISTTDPKTKKQVFGAEAIGDAIVAALQTTKINMVVINSVKMLVPMEETNKTLEENTMATQARFNAKLTKKIIPLIAQKETAMLCVQHYSTDLNAGMYGNPDIIAGGRALKYNNMLTLEFSNVSIKDGDPVTRETGLKFHVRVTKNHLVLDRNPYVDFYYCVEYGKGIERHITALQQLIAQGIIVQRGAWLYMLDANGEKDENMSWCGKNAFKQDMIDNPSKFDTLLSVLDAGGLVSDLSEEEIEELEAQDAEERAEKAKEEADIPADAE
jgi:RecA/RadA recombinase